MRDEDKNISKHRGRLNEFVEALELYRDFGVEYLVVGKTKRAGSAYSKIKYEMRKKYHLPQPQQNKQPKTETTKDSMDQLARQAQDENAGHMFTQDKIKTTDKSLSLFDLAEKETMVKIDPSEKVALLEKLRLELGNCTRCKLCHNRKNIVFGEGNPNARLMFVGEGPGATEDETGRPFVGRAGKLLDRMIAAMGLKREEVYIANIVKCRPPGNRDPEPDEVKICTSFLISQIEIIQPDVIISLGAPASKFLFGLKSPMSVLRGTVSRFRGAKLVATYHPAFLLRSPGYKKEAWKDLKKVMDLLGIAR